MHDDLHFELITLPNKSRTGLDGKLVMIRGFELNGQGTTLKMQGVGLVFLMSRVEGRCLPASYEKMISLEGLNSMSIIMVLKQSRRDQP